MAKKLTSANILHNDKAVTYSVNPALVRIGKMPDEREAFIEAVFKIVEHSLPEVTLSRIQEIKAEAKASLVRKN